MMPDTDSDIPVLSIHSFYAELIHFTSFRTFPDHPRYRRSSR